MDVIFIDHYDSFSFNLIDWLGGKNCPYQIHRIAFDDENLLERVSSQAAPIVLSPGPNSPIEAQATLKLVHSLWGKVPMFAVCLGHQIIGHYLGGRTIPAVEPFHGSIREISIIKRPPGLELLPDSLQAASYNSLVLDPKGLKEEWIFAKNCFDEVEGLFLWSDRDTPVLSLQFHPESFMSKDQEIFRQWWWQVVSRHFHRSGSKPQPLHPYQCPQNIVP